jgi:hypothetical protein
MMPECFQFALTTGEAARDLAKRMSRAQLAEKHGDELAPGGKSSAMAFGLGFFNEFLKFIPRKEL